MRFFFSCCCFGLLSLLLTLPQSSVFGQKTGYDTGIRSTSHVGSGFSFANIPRLVLSKAESLSDSPDLHSPFASFRIGVITTPVAGIDGGLDISFPQSHFAKRWVTRIDADLSARLISPSFGSRRDAALGLFFCQVYVPQGVNRSHFFGGFGLGPFIGPRSSIGGKIFGGIQVSRVVSLEAEGQFTGESTTRAVLMLRLSAL